MSGADLRILDAFPAPPEETYGLALARATGLGSGRVTQCLYRLYTAELIADRWEDVPDGVHRPPRRMYRLTPDGLRRRFEERAAPPVGRHAPEGS